ncbi:hypothetical protein [Ideonella sp.]|uniref:hypothetical protein n=1 Tax=Ideonella sp. TaxID=1929293 RepID=UPI002B471A72|nr:hypothetical protein [Ideonella sp.]HJV68443.1 hypothetical protein [Ideonella sp.]
MKPSLIRHARLLALVAATATAFSAHALMRGTTADGSPFVEGGIGADETTALEAQRDQYSLWLITAVRVSGAYLAEVQLRITDERGRVLLERKMSGPWLLVNLPLGRYELQASYRGETLRRTATIHAGDHHQVIFHFGVQGEMQPPPKPEAR